MKNIVFILCLFSLAMSQIEAGKSSIVGALAYNNRTAEKNNSDSQSQFAIAGTFGRFFKNNVMGGLEINYAKNTNESGEETYTNNVTAIGPTLRLYFDTGKTAPFFSIKYLFGSTSYELSDEFDTVDRSISSKLLGFNLGADFFVSNSVALEFQVKYDISNYTPKDAPDEYNPLDVYDFGFNVGFNIVL